LPTSLFTNHLTKPKKNRFNDREHTQLHDNEFTEIRRLANTDVKKHVNWKNFFVLSPLYEMPVESLGKI